MLPDPIALPDFPFADCEFDPIQPRDTNQMEGRRTESQSFGTPYWKARYKFEFLRREQLGRIDAFMMQAGDNGETFLGYDVSRPRPIAHDNGEPLSGLKVGGGAFDGLAVLQAILSSRSIIVSGLPASFKLSAGDYVEIRKSQTVRSLHRIMTDATASSGGIVTLAIRYGLDTGIFTTADTVNFEQPSCTMQIDPGSWSLSKAMDARSPSFAAIEVFL